MPRDFDETPTEGMKRIEQAFSPTAGAGRSMYGYNAGIGARSGPLSGGLMAAGDPTTGQPVMVGGRALAGPLSYQYMQPTVQGVPGTHMVGVGGKPFDADAYFGLTAQQGGDGRSYGVNVGSGGLNAYGQYNPSRRDLNVGGSYQANFAGGGPVLPSSDPMGSFTGVEGIDQEGREPGMYERMADRLAGAGVTVGEPIRQAAMGISDVPGSIGSYIAETSQKPDPSQRMAEDIRRFGGAFVDQAMSSPTEFAKTVGGLLPGIGEAISAYDAKHLYSDLQQAEAEGDTKKADTLRQLYGLAAAGAVPGAGVAARVAGKAKRGLTAAEGVERGIVEGVEREAIAGAEKAAVEAAEEVATAPALYKPVQQAYEDMPEPAQVRTQAVDHITESIDASDGAKAQLPTKMGLGPMYVVDSGVENVSKKSGFMLNDTKNANAARQLDGITPLMDEFPEMGTNPDQWAQAMSKAFGSKEVVAPPYRFMKAIESGEYTDLLKTLTPGQIADADAGFAAGKDFLKAYHSGQMGVEDTGKLFMWGIMSRGVNPFTHEGLFLDAFQGIEPFIKMAAEGKLTKEVANGPYKEWAATTAGKGSGQPGAGAMHNLNAFGKDFLVKMGKPGADGVTPMQKLHDLMSDPEMTGRDIRREFAKVGEGVGIDNKVVSFILLATGRDDVMVIDRIQLKNLWDDGRYADVNIWDGISVPTVKMKDGTTKRFPPTDEGRAAAKAFAKENPGSKGGNAAVTGSSLAEATYGAKGILVYEALEDALMKNVGKMYADLGRPEAASPGRFHWETWVARSNQEASHGTLPAILKKVQGSNNPLEGVYSKQGDYQSYAYGAKYGRSADGQPQFTIPLSTGEEIVMSPQQYSAALDTIRKPSTGVIPSGKGQKFNVTDTVGMPWYEREGVDRAKLDEVLRAAAARQEGPVRKAGGGPVSDKSGSGAGGRGTGQIGGPAASLDQKVDATVQDVAGLAEAGDIDQRKLAFLLRKASTGTMPADVSYEFAGEIMSHDTQALIQRFGRYPRSIRVLARVDLALGGLGGQELGMLANQKIRTEPASPTGSKEKGYAKGGKVARKPNTGDEKAFKQFSDFALENYGGQVGRNMVNRAGGDAAKLMFALAQYTKNLVAQDPERADLHQQQLQQLGQMANANKIDPRAAFNRTPDTMETRKELQEILKSDHNMNPAFKTALERMDRLVGSQ
jgi:hypothetical protein